MHKESKNGHFFQTSIQCVCPASNLHADMIKLEVSARSTESSITEKKNNNVLILFVSIMNINILNFLKKLSALFFFSCIHTVIAKYVYKLGTCESF